MALTPKQEKFAQLVASGLTQTEAYKQAYNVSKMGATTINREAHELARNPNISARVDELRKPIIEAHQYTLESYVKRMNEVAEMAFEQGQTAAGVKALENVGKVLGLYTNKTELSGPGGGPVTVQLVKKIIE